MPRITARNGYTGGNEERSGVSPVQPAWICEGFEYHICIANFRRCGKRYAYASYGRNVATWRVFSFCIGPGIGVCHKPHETSSPLFGRLPMIDCGSMAAPAPAAAASPTVRSEDSRNTGCGSIDGSPGMRRQAARAPPVRTAEVLLFEAGILEPPGHPAPPIPLRQSRAWVSRFSQAGVGQLRSVPGCGRLARGGARLAPLLGRQHGPPKRYQSRRLAHRFTSTTTRPRTFPSSKSYATGMASLRPISWVISSSCARSRSVHRRSQACTRSW